MLGPSRTHTCGALRADDVGRDVVLLGWVHRIRDLGSLLFIDVRDRFGITQVVVRDEAALLARAKQLKTEYVVAVIGDVERRSADTINPKMRHRRGRGAGARDLGPQRGATPPFPIADEGPSPRRCGCATATSTCAGRGCSRTWCCATG